MTDLPSAGDKSVSLARRKMLARRAFIGTVLSVPAVVLLDTFLIEPKWVRVRTLSVLPPARRQGHRLVHITDIHHRGDRAYLEKIVAKIKQLRPDTVCITGDLIGDMVDKQEHLDEALSILGTIQAPLYGVPGNHDYWSKLAFEPIAECFARTGGAWLMDSSRLTGDGKLHIIGLSGRKSSKPIPPVLPDKLNVLLLHYPAWVKLLSGKFDLILAGHSHGGQVRIPFYGAPVLPFFVDEYEVGLFETPAGPLYVNPGLGWFPIAARFNCRPEITLFQM